MSDNPKQSASSAAIRSPGPLESPILSFDLNAEIEQLRSENAWQGGTEFKNTGEASRLSGSTHGPEIQCATSRT